MNDHKPYVLDVERLSRLEQLIVGLYYYEDLNDKEISDVMDIPEEEVLLIRYGAAAKLRSWALLRWGGRAGWR